MKKNLAEILKKQNFITHFWMSQGSVNKIFIRIQLKYRNGLSAISGLRRISTPGLRVYKNSSDIPKVLNGLGIAVVSTSKGLLTDKEARKGSIGGEVVCYIW